jgi:hypothetical protein
VGSTFRNETQMSKAYPWYRYYPDRAVGIYKGLLWKWQSRNDPKPYVGENRCIHEDHHSIIVEVFKDGDVRFANGEILDWYNCTDPADHPTSDHPAQGPLRD